MILNKSKDDRILKVNECMLVPDLTITLGETRGSSTQNFHLHSKVLKRSNVLSKRFIFIYPPYRKLQFNFSNIPEKCVDGVDNIMGF